MLVGSGWGVEIRLTILSTNDPTIPLSFCSSADRFDIKLLDPLKASTAFLIVALSVADIVFEFNKAGAVSEKNLSMLW